MTDLVDEQEVTYEGASVMVRRCGPADLMVLCDWCDLYLAGDFHFKRRHMHGILTRGTSDVWAVLVGQVFSGLLILYRGSTLHNLYLDPAHRGGGIGSALLKHFNPAIIRAKCNMQAGDPTPFYEQNGYQIQGRDAERPHIAVMTRVGDLPLEAASGGEPSTVEPTDWLALKRAQNTERSRRRRARLKAAKQADSSRGLQGDSPQDASVHFSAPCFSFNS